MTDSLPELTREAARALNRGAYPELEVLAKKILQLDGANADAWFFLSITATERRKISTAVELINNAIKLNPKNVEYVAQKARLHAMAGDREAALASADYALSLEPEAPVVLDTLGVVYSRFEQHEKAREALQRGVAVDPSNHQFQFNLASVEQFLGDAEAASHSYLEAIRLKPDFYRAYWALSELEKNDKEAHRLETLAQLAKNDQLSAEDSLYLGHAISREYEKAGDYDQAFTHLSHGKAAMRKKINYSLESDRDLFAAMKAAFPEPIDSDGDLGNQNMFVLGMPRSGTTLVDRILSSHSKIVSMGEIQDFARAVKTVSGTSSKTLLDKQLIEMTSQLNFAEVGRKYLYSVGKRVDLQDFTLDKMPLNFLYVGFILSTLPGAKVICLRRHPVDTCLSNYRQLFAVDFSYYNYHYDLEHTAEYYSLFDDLMGHWQHIFGDRFHQVHYEALVADPESNVRQLCAVTGVEFEQQCLEFYKSDAAVSTASAMQVREPLYQSAVNRWQKYGKNLEPLMNALAKQGVTWQV